MKKKGVIILIVVLLVLAGGATAVYFYLQHKKDANAEYVYVCAVSDIVGGGYIGDGRYMGVVESQEVKGVNKDSDKTVKELYVKVEDEVKAGDILFEYDTQEMELKLKQLELELTSINNNISTMNQQINTLTAEKATAPEDEKLNYTAQIQNLQAQVNQANYDASAKQLEIDRQKASMENSSVVAPMDGIIKSINENSTGGSDYGNDYGSDSDPTKNAYIAIMAKGDYRVKGTASELNVRSMSEGDRMIIRSRVDDETWSATITKIDLEHPDTGNNDNYYYGGGGTSATKYPFYMSLDNSEGLMLGQHVYVEMDYGQGTVKSGLWLDSFYIVFDEDGSAFVWAEDKNGRIEKRKVELGEYDEELMRYEILSGLELTDFIAFPEPRVKEGMKATHNYEDVVVDDIDFGDMNYDEDMDIGGDGEFGGDFIIDGDDEGFYIPEDGMDTEGVIDDSSSIDNLIDGSNPYEGFDDYNYNYAPYEGFDSYY